MVHCTKISYRHMTTSVYAPTKTFEDVCILYFFGTVASSKFNSTMQNLHLVESSFINLKSRNQFHSVLWWENWNPANLKHWEDHQCVYYTKLYLIGKFAGNFLLVLSHSTNILTFCMNFTWYSSSQKRIWIGLQFRKNSDLTLLRY